MKRMRKDGEKPKQERRCRYKLKRTAKQYLQQFADYRDKAIAKGTDVTISTRRKKKRLKKTFTPKQLAEFRQCYTDDVTAKYYLARHQLPKNWFADQQGNVLYTAPDGIYLLKGSIRRKTKRIKTMRERYSFYYINEAEERKFINLDPGAIVNLTFEGDASNKALAEINASGLDAFKKDKKTRYSKVELSHIKGYVTADTDDELRALRAENGALSNTQFLTFEEHKCLTFLRYDEPAADEEKEKAKEKKAKEIKLKRQVRMMSDAGSDDCFTLFAPDNKGNGYILQGKQILMRKTAYNINFLKAMGINTDAVEGA